MLKIKSNTNEFTIIFSEKIGKKKNAQKISFSLCSVQHPFFFSPSFLLVSASFSFFLLLFSAASFEEVQCLFLEKFIASFFFFSALHTSFSFLFPVFHAAVLLQLSFSFLFVCCPLFFSPKYFFFSPNVFQLFSPNVFQPKNTFFSPKRFCFGPKLFFSSAQNLFFFFFSVQPLYSFSFFLLYSFLIQPSFFSLSAPLFFFCLLFPTLLFCSSPLFLFFLCVALYFSAQNTFVSHAAISLNPLLLVF